jgi:hypothetical protein
MNKEENKKVFIGFRIEKIWFSRMRKYLDHPDNINDGKISSLIRYCIKQQLPVLVKERTPSLLQ